MGVGRAGIVVGLVAAIALLAGGAFVTRAADDDACLGCHSGGNAGRPELDVDAKSLRASVHGDAGLRCVDCHADLASVTDFPHGKPGPPACGTCHETEREAVEKSAHRQEDPDSPRCWSCHGGHDVLAPANAKSKIAPLQQPATCLKCHANPKVASAHGLPVREPVEAFEKSTHYQQLLSGNAAAPTCTTCHGAHDNVSHKDPNSPITRSNVAKTCGRCHGEIEEKFEKGIHGSALAKGNPDVPTCTGCHTEHAIRGPEEPSSPVYATHVATTCSHCHGNERLTSRYGLDAVRMKTYLGSYHGAANRFGDVTVANCASCHGAHDILPSSDPASSINPANLAHTCGKCHPQAGSNFATGRVHVQVLRGENYWAWLVRRMYLSMIWTVIGGFVVLILVDLWGRYRESHATRSGA